MPRHTPFHPRTQALCHSYAWKEWAGYLAVTTYDRHSEREYFAFRHTAGLLDVTPLFKYEVKGPDAAALLSKVWCRDVAGLSVGQVVYAAMADERGKCLDDGTIARLSEEHYRVTSSEPWLGWLLRHARGLRATVEDSSDALAALALQGPLSRDVLRQVVDFDIDRMRFFRVRRAKLAGAPVWISRTGYTGDLGFEIWTENQHALAVWDALAAAGVPYGLEPAGLDALDVVRIEAGYVLQGNDYISAKSCLNEARKSSPFEAGLGWTVELDRGPFIGQEALRQEAERGSRWAMVGLELSWPEVEALHFEYDLPPYLAPVASRLAVPIYDPGGRRQVGQATSRAWSPLLKRYLAIGQVYREFSAEGTRLRVEHTVDFHRRQVTGVVCARPFFDPERKRDFKRADKAAAAAPERSEEVAR